jgi:hypothetical protein
MRIFLCMSAVAVLLSSCASGPPDLPPPAQTPASRAAGSSPHGPSGQEGGGESKLDAPIDAKVAALRVELAKDPQNAQARTAFVSAALENANYYMFNETLPPMKKYPSALRYYRAVLAVEPDHEEARRAVETIESIYAAMDRPLPETEPV